MANSRFNLAGLLIALLAAPIWALVAIEVSLRSPDRYLNGPIVLCGMTLVIHHLLRSFKNSWPLSALSAGLVSLGVLLLSAG